MRQKPIEQRSFQETWLNRLVVDNLILNYSTCRWQFDSKLFHMTFFPSAAPPLFSCLPEPRVPRRTVVLLFARTAFCSKYETLFAKNRCFLVCKKRLCLNVAPMFSTLPLYSCLPRNAFVLNVHFLPEPCCDLVFTGRFVCHSSSVCCSILIGGLVQFSQSVSQSVQFCWFSNLVE